ncbi:inositol monophosphatase family protein [Candidatus Tisiphia endosymbiont of Nemotelus uliginosus]|uniref:inositol monophosphatase family protein n=1 Tax=Candidatus Tisiphia endosymbiont of Nemotelus uliginosus TaxID=3077926 RepID=UPI0035C87F5A
MDTLTHSLIAISCKVVKFLRRDFLELEMLQRSSKGNYGFCQKSYIKIQDLLSNELRKYSKHIFFPNDQFTLNTVDSEEMILMINPIDSLDNLERSLPFFALSITSLRKINNVFTATCSVINFPALDQLYYVEKGRGVKSENSNVSRLRVSSRSTSRNALIAVDNINTELTFFKDTMMFGSHCYSILMLIAGKVDAVYFSSLNYTLRVGFELLVSESGGAMIGHDKAFIATNYELVNEFKNKIILE